MNKRYEKKTKAKKFSRSTADNTRKQADLEELIKKDKAKEDETLMRPWVKLDSLNNQAKGDCSFLKENLLQDIKAK